MEDMFGEQGSFYLWEYKCRPSWAELGDRVRNQMYSKSYIYPSPPLNKTNLFN
jgi:hypothetical protein